MAKQNGNDNAQSLAVSEKNQDQLTHQNVKATAGDVINDFSAVPDNALQALTGEYLQLEENKTYNMVFKGMTTFNDQMKGEMPAVELVDEAGMVSINANTVLVKALSKVTQMPCLVRIITGSKVRSKSGNTYLDMEILTLGKSVQK